MKQILSLVLSTIFILLSILHFYWASGGQWALKNALPKNISGETILNPSPMTTVIVGIVLGLMASYYMTQAHLFQLSIPSTLLTIAGYTIPAIFILRAIGDFKYVGFFKSITETEFARMDIFYYSPLCLMIGVISIIILIID